MAFGIEEQILWFNVTVCNALTVEVENSFQHLLETALDFARAHSTAWENIVSTRFKWKVRFQHEDKIVTSGELSVENRGGNRVQVPNKSKNQEINK